MRDLFRLWNYLKGKRTYIVSLIAATVAFITAVATFALNMEFIDQETYSAFGEYINSILVFLGSIGLAALRAGVNGHKNEERTRFD